MSLISASKLNLFQNGAQLKLWCRKYNVFIEMFHEKFNFVIFGVFHISFLVAAISKRFEV
jgi:hypothetical protein